MTDGAALEHCLPPALRGAGAKFTPLAGGLSGAGVHRVDVAGRTLVVKLSSGDGADVAWRARLELQRLAADGGVVPPIVYTDEAHRSMVSEFIVDHGFPGMLMNPATRQDALALLGKTMRRVHDLPVPTGLPRSDVRAFLDSAWSNAKAQLELPTFVNEVVARALADSPPDPGRADVPSHNDVNPGNMVFDGERIMLLDWDTAGIHEPFYDLATISVFFRLDEAACLRMLEAHDGSPATALPPRFAWDRRVVASLCSVMFLGMAGRCGHRGATGAESLVTTPTLSDCYQRMRAGELSHATPDGQWAFGLAMSRESSAL